MHIINNILQHASANYSNKRFLWYNYAMSKKFKNKRYFKHRSYGNGSNSWNPVVRFLISAIGIILAVSIVSIGAMIALEAVFHIDTPIKPDGIIANGLEQINAGDLLVCSPTPYFTPEPTQTPHPMDSFNGGEIEREIVLPSDISYPWFGKPYCYGNKIIFSAGKVIDGKSLMCALMEYNIDSDSESVTELNIESKNGQLLNPVFNDKWLVYLDGNTSNGGGDICVLELNNGVSSPIVIKTVYACQPEFSLYGDYFTWIERTGTLKDKVFVCHIPSMETTVVQTYTQSGYGTSKPHMYAGRIIWAADDNIAHEDGRVSSALKYIDLESGGISEMLPDVYIHDPQYNGNYYAWLGSSHDADAALYVYNGSDAPVVIDTGVVEFDISDKFVAYGKNEAVWVYLFSTGAIYRITPERESAQFLGTSNGYILWMDVTSRERDIIRYVSLPEF